MTTIIALAGSTGACLYTDAACYDAEGRIGAIHQKADAHIHLPGIIATRGSDASGAIFRLMVSLAPSFDELLKHLSDMMRRAAEEGMALGDALNLGAVLVGWSAEHEAWQSFQMFVRGESFEDLAEGSLQLNELASFHIEPFPDREQ